MANVLLDPVFGFVVIVVGLFLIWASRRDAIGATETTRGRIQQRQSAAGTQFQVGGNIHGNVNIGPAKPVLTANGGAAIDVDDERRRDEGMTRAPKDITVCNLEVVVMPNGEVICNGRSLGWVNELGKYLTPTPTPTPERER